jgi:hypothetical protein
MYSCGVQFATLEQIYARSRLCIRVRRWKHPLRGIILRRAYPLRRLADVDFVGGDEPAAPATPGARAHSG